MHDFEDIRPYHDSEVRPVVDSLLGGLDLSKALAKFRFPGLYRMFPAAVSHLFRSLLRRELKNVQTIHDVQIIIEKYLDRLIETTTDGLTHDGLEKLSADKAYLFISNHRDITMDPALVNYMLYHQGFRTVQIAIGDNLLKKPWLSDLMRLNKSFIVKRSLQGREKLKASRQLSAYIHHCVDNGENVWIAQREGRAKDGIDKTEAAIIKMLHMADREPTRALPLFESINSLNIVPVAISYEFDPCDQAKAMELHAIDNYGKFVKDENSDVQSILNGMIGNKGAVHVAFGKPVQVEAAATAEGIAMRIDEQVIVNYRLHCVNYLAMQMQSGSVNYAGLASKLGFSEAQVAHKHAELEKRLEAMPAQLRPYILSMYANPVIRQQEVLDDQHQYAQ
ncbi:MAG: 1-acyl-sn-glycerol-3-phosphate acyltransferase [Pseudohongiellaceae bacterium]